MQEAWFSQSAVLLPQIFTAAAALSAGALAIFSKRLSVLLGSVVLALVSICIVVSPSSMPEAVAVGCCAGSLIVAVSGIVAHQKARAVQTAIDGLRRDVDALSHSEQRRFMKELKDQSASVVPKTDGPSVEGDGIRPDNPIQSTNERTVRKSRKRTAART